VKAQTGSSPDALAVFFQKLFDGLFAVNHFATFDLFQTNVNFTP
jgi:hypothetical protein